MAPERNDEETRISTRELKQKVLNLLKSADFQQALDDLTDFPLRKVLNPLISLFCSTDPLIRGRAVTAVGVVVEELARQDREAARIVMRRFMWMLNDESGGIGWGVPEAMAEVMARDEKLADEFADILVSYMDEQGNYLEYEALQRGLMWGLARISENRADHVRRAADYLPAFVHSSDPAIRGPALEAAARIMGEDARGYLECALEDDAEFLHYERGELSCISVKNMGRRAMKILDSMTGSVDR